MQIIYEYARKKPPAGDLVINLQLSPQHEKQHHGTDARQDDLHYQAAVQLFQQLSRLLFPDLYVVLGVIQPIQILLLMIAESHKNNTFPRHDQRSRKYSITRQAMTVLIRKAKRLPQSLPYSRGSFSRNLASCNSHSARSGS